MGLFGSLTKGYAIPESDIDAILFIDTKQAEVEAGKTEQNPAVKNLSEYRAALQSEFQTFLEKQLDVHTEQTSHVFAHFVDESEIRRVLEDPKAEDQAVDGLFRLFLLSLGKGIRPYRQTVIETLEKQGVNGKRKWEMIIHKLAEFENPEIVSNGKLLTHMNAQREWLYPSLQKSTESIFTGDADGFTRCQKSGLIFLLILESLLFISLRRK